MTMKRVRQPYVRGAQLTLAILQRRCDPCSGPLATHLGWSHKETYRILDLLTRAGILMRVKKVSVPGSPPSWWYEVVT